MLEESNGVEVVHVTGETTVPPVLVDQIPGHALDHSHVHVPLPNVITNETTTGTGTNHETNNRDNRGTTLNLGLDHATQLATRDKTQGQIAETITRPKDAACALDVLNQKNKQAQPALAPRQGLYLLVQLLL